MKRENVIIMAAIVCFLFCLSSAALPKYAKASGTQNLKERKEYAFNLDQKGKSESVSFSMDQTGCYRIQINGQVVKKIQFEEYYYDPHMQITDIDKKDGKLDIWVYVFADSEDIRYSALYQYDRGTLDRIWNLKESGNYDKAYDRGCGFLSAADGKGKFTVVMDRAVNNTYLTGNHFDKVVFQLKAGKVSQVSKKIYRFYRTFGSGKNKDLIAAEDLKFYQGHDKAGETISVNKGTKCKPILMYVANDSQVYVQYRLEDGSKGWLCSDDWTEYDHLPFKDMLFAD